MTRGDTRLAAGWMLGAVSVGGLVAWLLLAPSPPAPARPEPARPATAYAAEIEAPELAASTASAAAEATAPTTVARPAARPRDALRVATAVAGTPERRFVIDVAGIVQSAPGQAMVRCINKSDARSLKRLREEARFRPFEQIERVAVAGDMAAFSGDFKGVRWAQTEKYPTRMVRYGEHGRLYLPDDERPWRKGFGVWKDEIVLGGGDRAGLEAAIDRLEGRGAIGPGQRALGHASGVVPAADVFEMLRIAPDVAGPLSTLLEEQGAQVQFRVDVGDWGLKVGVELLEADADSADALSAAADSALQGGLAPGQQTKLAPLLAGLGVTKGEAGDFKVSLPIPMPVLKGLLGPCAEPDE